MFRVKINFDIYSTDVNQTTSGFENFSDANDYLETIAKHCKSYVGGYTGGV